MDLPLVRVRYLFGLFLCGVSLNQYRLNFLAV
jgi:hypothetical protein